MNINEQIQQLIADAKKQGVDSPDILADEIKARWNPVAAMPPVLTLDEDGRYRVPGSSVPWITDLPMRLGMNLTTRQAGNIMANCGVNAKGERQPAAFLGFETNTAGATNPVSWQVGRQYWNQPAGGPYPKLSPDTRRGRFDSLAQHVAYVAANPWVQ